jgi:signal transduction histidine kinase
MSSAASGIFLLFNEDILNSKSYYETSRFSSEYSRLMHNTVELHVKLRNEGVIISGASSSTVSDDTERYQLLQDRMANTVNFAYYIKNSATGDVLSNVNAAERVALLKKQPTYVYSNERVSSMEDLWYQDDIKKMLSGTNSEVHTAVIEPLKQGDVFYEDYMNFSKVKSIVPYLIGLLCASFAVMLAAFIYLIYVAGRREKKGIIFLSSIDRIYTDVHTILVFIAAIISVLIVGEISNGSNNTTLFVAVMIGLSIDALIGLSYILSMVRQLKNRQILTNSLTYKLFVRTKKLAIFAFSGKLFKAWILLALLGYGAINGVLLTIFLLALRNESGFEFLFSGLLLLGFNVATVYFAAKSLRSLTQIMEAAKELASGNLDYSLDTEEMSAAFIGFTEDLQGVQSGLKKAVAEAVKGERMKTELITNVSHDLKTPLTSIINYVDLLKKEDLENENAVKYVEVLEEKSARLKQLVEDLIEASKASSGNLAVSTEKVDMHQLVMQAYGEYEEKIVKASLDIRINTSEKELFVLADGKYLWRVIENLLSNVLKYSMHNSRVYISIDKNEKYGILTIKNISAFPLEISPEQLTERFIRGDASRTTEGSGLGLSIAQGLTKLQGGRFKVDIDGDLFKVTLEIPLWEEI